MIISRKINTIFFIINEYHIALIYHFIASYANKHEKLVGIQTEMQVQTKPYKLYNALAYLIGNPVIDTSRNPNKGH